MFELDMSRSARNDSPGRMYAEPDRRLLDSFERWMVEADLHHENEAYLKGEELTQNLTCTVDEAHALLIKFQDHKRIYLAGTFISVLYNKMPCKEIVCDLPLKIDHLGYCLPSDKILLNYGCLGSYAGRGSSGCLVNFGVVDGDFGRNSTGLIVNYGASENIGSHVYGTVLNFSDRRMDAWSSRGIFIDAASERSSQNISELNIIVHDPSNAKYLCDAEGFNSQIIGKKINEAECKKIPELFNYVQSLRVKFEAGKANYSEVVAAIRELGDCPDKKIRQDIEEILRRAGKDV
jgi:hypothetical protein